MAKKLLDEAGLKDPMAMGRTAVCEAGNFQSVWKQRFGEELRGRHSKYLKNVGIP